MRMTIFLALLLALTYTAAASQPRALQPMWSARVDGQRLVILANEFSAGQNQGRGSFPSLDLLINRVLTNGDDRWGLRREVALVSVRPDGTANDEMHFVGGNLISSGRSERIRTILVSPSSDLRFSSQSLQVMRSDLGDPASVSSWERSSDGEVGLLHIGDRTIFVNSSGSVVAQLPYKTFDTTFATHAPRVAFGVRDSSRSDPITPDARWISVRNYKGEVLRETVPAPQLMGQLFLNASGEYVMYDVRQILNASGSSGPPELNVLEVRSGEVKAVRGVPIGLRYYSGDGKSMLVLQTGPGRGFFFDVGNPFDPVLLWDVSAESPVGSAAVSADGSLVALHRLRPTDRRYKDVLLFNREGLQVAIAHQEVNRRFFGLEFVGEYLLVGVPLHPLPMYNRWKNTEGIDLLDVSPLLGSD